MVGIIGCGPGCSSSSRRTQGRGARIRPTPLTLGEMGIGTGMQVIWGGWVTRCRAPILPLGWMAVRVDGLSSGGAHVGSEGVEGRGTFPGVGFGCTCA